MKIRNRYLVLSGIIQMALALSMTSIGNARMTLTAEDGSKDIMEEL